MTVRLVDTANGFTLRLDAKRSRFVTRELAHEKRVRPHHKGIKWRSDPNCLIVVRTPAGNIRRYQLYDSMTVLEEKTKQSWSFYAGLLLYRWLRQAQPAKPPVPFNPAVP